MHKKLIPLLLGVSVIFVFLLKTKMILEHGEDLTVLKVFILENFQCIMGLDS